MASLRNISTSRTLEPGQRGGLIARRCGLAAVAIASLLIAHGAGTAVRADVVADLHANVPSTAGYTTDYTLNIGGGNSFAGAGGVPYTINNSSLIATGSFTSIGYYLELGGSSNFNNGWVYVEFNASGFNTNASMLGVPTNASGEYYHYGQVGTGQVANMTVESNLPSNIITTGTGISTGSVQFWPSNYGQNNDYNVPNPVIIPGSPPTNVTNNVFDFADGSSSPGQVGYGAMQINNYGAQQTIFAFNNWNGGGGDLGIGNDPQGGNPNYTFQGNAGDYTLKSMAIVVNTTGGGLPIWSNSTNDGLWATAANWQSGVVPNAAGTQIGLGQQSGSSTIDLGLTPETVGAITFSPVTNTSIISTGGATLTLDNAGSASLLSVTGGDHAISAPVALNNDLSFSGSSGSLTMSGGITSNGHNLSVDGNLTVNLNSANPNIIGGNFSVNAGTVNENAVGGFGSAHVNVNNGATLNMSAANDTPGSGADINNGNLNVQQGGMNLANTVIHGAGNLNLNADQGSTGGIAPTSSIQGTVNLGANQSAGYNLNFDNGSTLQAQGGAHAFAGNLNLTSAGGNTNLGTSGQNLNLTGSITGTGGLTQNGTGTTTLSGPTASYSGATNVNAGTLALQTALTGGAAVNVNPGGTLNVGTGGSVNGSALTVNNGLATVTGNTNLGSGPASITGGGTVRFDSANTSFTGTTMNFNNGTINAHSGVADLSGTNLVAVPFTNAVAANAFQTNQYPLGSNTTNQSPNQGNGVAATADVANHYITGDLSTPISSPLLNAAHEGPTPGGINFPVDSDGSFKTFFNTPGTNDFGSTFYGVFTAPTAGSFHFAANRNDDEDSVVVQSLANTTGGHFNSAGPGLQTASNGCCSNDASFDVTATAGQQFLVAFTMRDDGGGSGIVGSITAPGGAQMVVDPGSAAQAGWWSTVNPVANGGATANIDTNATLKANSFTGFTNVNLANGSTLAISTHSSGPVINSDTTNMSVTGTGATAALNLGALNTVHVQNLSVPSGDTLNVGGIGGVGGALKVEGTGGVGTGTVAVTGGASYGGGGMFAGTLSIGPGGTLAPGDAANTMVGGLTLADGSNMTYNLNTAGVTHQTYNPANGNDLTTVINNNALTLASHSFSLGTEGTTVNITAGPNFNSGLYELLAYTGTFTGQLSSFGIGTAPSGYDYQFLNVAGAGGGQIDLLVTPEPSTVVLMGLGLVGLVLHCRRRLAKRAA